MATKNAKRKIQKSKVKATAKPVRKQPVAKPAPKKVVSKKVQKSAKPVSKKVPKVLPATRHPVEPELPGQAISDARKKKIRELVLHGMSHGYVTQDDIFVLFPDAAEHVEERNIVQVHARKGEQIGLIAP